MVHNDLLHLLAMHASHGKMKQGPLGEKVGGCTLYDIATLFVHHNLICSHMPPSLQRVGAASLMRLNKLLFGYFARQ